MNFFNSVLSHMSSKKIKAIHSPILPNLKVPESISSQATPIIFNDIKQENTPIVTCVVCFEVYPISYLDVF